MSTAETGPNRKTDAEEQGMLTEQRYEMILKLLNEKKSITVTEIRDLLGISESTARRDINALHQAGRLTRVFGGAVASDIVFVSQEPTVEEKQKVHMEEKKRIAAYAASLIQPQDFVFLDAGTTTGCMLEYITERSATYVTNAVAHAQRLAALGYRVLLVGGELKSSTEAVVGNQAIHTILGYHFTRGFFGANGISRTVGFTTPDANEALVKQTALKQCRECYILGDYSKFDNISSVTFGEFEDAVILTDRKPESYGDCDNIRICL